MTLLHPSFHSLALRSENKISRVHLGENKLHCIPGSLTPQNVTLRLFSHHNFSPHEIMKIKKKRSIAFLVPEVLRHLYFDCDESLWEKGHFANIISHLISYIFLIFQANG